MASWATYNKAEEARRSEKAIRFLLLASSNANKALEFHERMANLWPEMVGLNPLRLGEEVGSLLPKMWLQTFVL